MNREQVRIGNRYDYSEHSQVEHFINDVKYATISLNSERQKITSEYADEILFIDILSIKERFMKDYKALFQLLDNKLHTKGMVLQKKEFDTLIDCYQKDLDTIILKMNQLIQIQQKYNKKFLPYSMNHLKDMMDFNRRLLEGDSRIAPSRYWLNVDYYDQIREYMDETQTRVEELQRAKKRILKVWDPMILDEEYEEILEEFHKVQDGNLKFLNTSFWKIRKQLRRLFIEDIELLDEQEYKVLYHNCQIVRENETWLRNEEENIVKILGNKYQAEKICFETIRRNYESFYTFLMEYKNVDFSSVVSLMELTFPKPELISMAEKGFPEIIELCINTQNLLKQLSDDYYFFYHKLRKPKEEYSINDVRKTIYLIERIQQKKKWLSANSKRIISIFGTNQLTSKTDWKQYLSQQCKTKKEYEFSIYQQYISCDIWKGTVYELFDAIIKQEQPIHEKLILKRAANICNLVRVTPSLKREFQLYCNGLNNEYEVTNGFIELKDKEEIEFRLPGSEKREISMIADSELKAGILKIIEIEQEITLDQVGKVLCQKLGFQRRNQAFTNCIERLVKELKKEGFIIRKSAGWRLT